MAAITRQTWAEMRSEVLRRIGSEDASPTGDLAVQIQYALYAAELSLGLTFHHYELELLDPAVAMTPSSNLVTLPVDCYIVLSAPTVTDIDPGVTTSMTPEHPYTILQAYRGESGIPDQYARVGNDLFFNREADAADTISLYYYKKPPAPDFDLSTSPTIDWLWDEYLIQYAMSLLWPQQWRFDLAQVQREGLEEWFRRTVAPALAVQDLSESRVRPLVGETTGRPQ